MNFNTWLNEVNKLAIADVGRPVDDYEDYNWFDEFDNDVDPDDAYDEWKSHTESGTRSPC